MSWTKVVALAEMVEAMSSYPDHQAFRYYQASTVVEGVPSATVTYRVSMAQVRAEVKALKRFAIPALRALATKPCYPDNCGTACLCDSCLARKALETFDPEWNP